MSIEIPSSKVVLCDMDGVIADFDGEVRARMRIRHPDILPLELQTPDFYTANNYPEEHRDKVWAISNEPGFIASLPVVEDAIEGWQRIVALGFRPRACSTLLPIEYSPSCKAEKLAWLEEHFAPVLGPWVTHEAVFTPDKHLISGMALIEDRQAPLRGADTASWEHIVFDWPYNRSPADTLRLQNWADPRLPEVLAEAQERHLKYRAYRWQNEQNLL